MIEACGGRFKPQRGEIAEIYRQRTHRGRRLVLPGGRLDLSWASKLTRRHEAGVNNVVSRIVTMAIATDQDGFTPIHSSLLRAVFGRYAATQIMDELTANGLIERTRSYTPGERSKQYRLGVRLRDEPLRHLWVQDDESLAAWYAIRNIDPGAVEPPDEIRDHLRWNALRFSIDEHDWADGLARAYDDDDDPMWLKRMCADVTLLSFTGEPHDMWGSYCDFGGRWHSIYSRWARSLRKSWRFNGERLWIVDAKSLQPLIQAIQAAREAGHWPELEECYAIAMADAAARAVADPIPLVAPEATAAARPPSPTDQTGKAHTIVGRFSPFLHGDLRDFGEAYFGGDFYRSYAGWTGRPWDESRRDAIKQEWAHDTYCNPLKATHTPGWLEDWGAYHNAQPTVAGWIDRVKRDDYKNAPRLCQQFESRVMIRGAVGILMREHPDLPLITIHDGFATTKEGIPIVLDAFIRSWAPEGVIPRFKVEAA